MFWWYTEAMDKELQNHKKYMQQQLAKKDLTVATKQQLLTYHLARVRDFQHERLIHLLVTFFFAGLLLLSLFCFILTPLPELRLPLGALTLILAILEVFYIRHYYQLENGTQALYAFTKQLQSGE